MIEGHLYTEGVVKDSYLEEMKAQIASLPVDAEIIIHHIKSPGGSVYAAWKTIPELLKIGKPIKSLIEGEASSIASWIAVAPAFEVEATDPSTAMIHEPFFPDGINGALSVDDLDTARVELDQIRQSMAQAYAKKSGKPVDYWLAVMKKNTRLNAQMLKAEGLVDKIIMTEPRRIAAEVMDVIKTDLNNLKNEIMNLFGRRAVASAPIAVDLPLKDGKMLNVQSENGDLVGKPATIDGAPAEGSYPLNDGRTITCAGGVVTAVTEAGTMPQETEAQRLQKELAATQAKLTALQAAEEAKAKAKAEEDAKAAEAAKQAELVKAVEDAKKLLAEQAAKIEALEKQPVGDQSKPKEPVAMSTMNKKSPFGMVITSADQKAIYASRTFLADHMPQMERHYPNGKYADGTRFFDYRTGGPNAVSILETNFTYTWQGQLTTDLFYKPYINCPPLADVFMVDTGSKDKKRYNIIPTLDKVLKPYTGCDQAVTGTSLDITDKYIQLKPFRMKEKWCVDDFTGRLTGTFNHLAQEWTKDGNQAFDPAGTPINQIIMYSLKEAQKRDVFRRVFLGDSDSSSADWNQINGLITTVIDQSGASNYCVRRSGSALGIGSLSAGQANTILQGLWDDSNQLLKEQGIDAGKAVLIVTRSIWDNYYTYLTGVGAVTEQQYDNYVKGLSTLYFRGVPLKPYGILDTFLADAACPLYATTRHLALLTMPDNNILGVENTSDLGNIKSWFSDDDNVRYYSSQMTFGVLAPIHCDLTTIAY